MIDIRPMTEEETKDERIKIQAEEIASLKRHILRLEKLGLEMDADDGSPLTPHGEAIAAGDGTLHGAIDYWQQQAFTMAAGQCCVKDGGLMADDHGHQYCDMERQRDELKKREARWIANFRTDANTLADIADRLWTALDIVGSNQPDPLGEALNSGDGSYRP